MLLPSDIARLVLGYLQEEGLSATSRAFIHESPNLKEYAEHSTEDGTIPACVFSIFGKGLTTILNEYVAVKTKESNHQVPAMVSSLWKKLDFTLNQIKSLQNSPALSACQRIRTRVGMANVARQKALTDSSTSVMCTTVSETLSIVSPAQTSHCVLTHSTPVSFSGAHRLTPVAAPHLQNHEGSRLLNTPRESPVNVTEHRLNPAPLSPGRRKWKRTGVVGGSSSSSRPAAAGGAPPEEEPEEIADENFPQLVIQNARDKILGDRLLQEKLAENINKILASEPTPQSSKACTNIVEPDQSIDEILGLQGEIHMSDDAIHDILEQTESDPAFQALFDLFEYNKAKAADGELGDGDLSSSPDEGELLVPAPPPVTKPSQNVDSAVVQKEAADPASVKVTATERKTRKSAPALKKTVITSSRSSRIDNCLGNLLVVQEPRQGTSSAKTSEKSPHPGSTPMEIDEPQATAATTPTTNVPTASVASVSNIMPLPITSMVSETTNLNRAQENKSAQRLPGTKDSASSAPQTAPSSSPSTSAKGAHLGSSSLVSPEPSKTTVSPSSSASPVSISNSSASSTAEQSGSNKTVDNPNDIVSLKIIISENQEEDSGADAALNQAVSSISGDKIPTIYLSSPARTSTVPGTPRSTSDEAAQAVSCLQRSESVVASPLSSQQQQSYIIQLPFDGAATSATSYFVLTEPPAPDAQSRQMIVPAPVTKGQAIAPNPFTLTPQRQGFSAGSTLILPSPMKSVVLPLSVVGQNTLGNMQMMSNQLVAVPNSPVVQQTEAVKPLPAGAVKQSAPSGPDKNVNNKVLPSLAPGHATQNASASPGSAHRRILRFDSNGESQTSKASTPPSASTSQPLPRTKPSILSANKPKRRIEPVRCSDAEKTPPPNQRRGSRKQEYVCNKEPGSSSTEVSKSAEPRRRSKSADGKQNDTNKNNNRAKDSNHSKSSSSDSSKSAEPRKRSKSTDGKQNDMDEAKDSNLSKSSPDSSQKPGSRKEKEPAEKWKSRDGRAEKRTQETTNVTANKENELKGQEQQSASSSAAPPQAKSSKAQSKTSALAKQAAEMLHDIQALNSPSAPKELSGQEESGSDCPKTPMRTRKGREGEGTPRHLVPPSGSDVPTCSPASEAGSESSINMAAHTLMILSRSALARPGTPLKDSLRQEGAGERSPAAAKNAKKRKQSTPTSSPPAKKEPKRTPSKKKERKKLMECFPQDLDVDKFLSSLHYDE